MRHPIRAFLMSLACAVLALPALAETDPKETGCGHTIESIPKTVQSILTPTYAGAAGVDLKAVAKQMSVLMLEAGHCQAITRSHENRSTTKQSDLIEWHSLNQWLCRLANFVDLNSRGKHSIDWREEYKVFAEVCEFSI